MVWLRKTAKAVAVYKATWTHRAILLLFLVLLHHQQWLFIDMICSYHPRYHCSEMSLLMHVILCKIRVRPGYFIKWVRPVWPRQKVTRLTRMIQMTWPGCNIDWEHSTTVCALMVGRTCLRLAHLPPLPPPTYPPLIHDTCDITWVVKKPSQKPVANTVQES